MIISKPCTRVTIIVLFHMLASNSSTCCYAFLNCSTLCQQLSWYFTFVQGFVKQMVSLWRTYVQLSAVLMGSNGLTKASLAFLNYSVQIMFKSTKVKLAPFFFFPLPGRLAALADVPRR